MRQKQSLLIITEHPPMSYRPAGERIFHLASTSGGFFSQVLVLSLWGKKKGNSGLEHEDYGNSKVLLYSVNFVRATLYPFVMLFDPVKFLVFLVHSLILSRRYKPSYILASMPPFETGACAWLLSKTSSSKLIIDLRDDWESAVSVELKRYFPSIVFKALLLFSNKTYQGASVLLAATETIRNTVRQRGVTTPIIVAPNGADTSVFLPADVDIRRSIRKKFSLPQEKVVVTYCGSGTIPYYRLDVVLSALASLSQEAKKRIFVVFYVYDGADGLRRIQNSLGIQHDMLGIRNPLPRKSLARLLSACDLALLPFDDDEYLLCARSTKLYEYLSAGLYVISSGPRGGELDGLFSANPGLGSFISPTAKDFAASLDGFLETNGTLLSENLRRQRHRFVEDNYDRKTIFKTTINALLERMTRSN